MKQHNISAILKVVVTGLIVCITSFPLPASDEEFIGPFASWRDLKRDYDVVGDGKTDDSTVLQRALDELTKHEKACVLYIPAGTYRLTVTVQTNRKEHTDCQSVAVIGENYLEAVGMMTALKSGVAPSSVRRPLEETRVCSGESSQVDTPTRTMEESSGLAEV
ncbi:MAG: glycosyl hydrolase family 28-related protein [Planctomycetota bacterium]